MLLQEAFLLSAFWFAVSTAFFSHANRSYNNKEHQHRHGHTRVNSDGGVIRRKYPLDVRLFQPSRMTPAQWKSSSSSSLAAAAATTRQKIQEHQELVKVGDCIGSGSYGTVHLLTVRNMKSDDTFECIGKRAWTLQELEKQTLSKDASDVKDRAKRCAYYWGVGRHCFEKLPPHVGLPIYRGVLDDDSTSDDGSQGPWLLFDFAEGDNNAPAPCLQDIMAKDRLDQKEHHQHHLHFLQQALRAVSTESDLCSNPVATTIEALLEQLLQVLHHVHDHNIVHRDVKPGNLLLSDGHVILIDFGSAADVDTAGILKENIGWGDRVSISPVYAAPEVFCDPNRSAVNFDTFSVGLIACQLLFQYLDERTDAGFLQQLTAVDNDLDAWLKSQWQSKVLPAGLVEGLDVLSDRPGLWGLIQGMLQTDPTDRLSSAEALKRLREIRAGKVTSDADGTYLNSIFTALEEPCPVSVPVARALDFVASFRRGESLGLVLAQADAADTSEMDAAALILWNQAVEGSGPGQVFVQGIVEGGQADEAGIFEIGDQLQGVGELPVAQGGFEKVVEMVSASRRLLLTTL
jgi:serine/threonine protein kinase